MCVFFLVRIYPSALFSMCAFFRVLFFPSALFSHALISGALFSYVLIYICAYFWCAFFLCAFFQCAFFRSPSKTYDVSLNSKYSSRGSLESDYDWTRSATSALHFVQYCYACHRLCCAAHASFAFVRKN